LKNTFSSVALSFAFLSLPQVVFAVNDPIFPEINSGETKITHLPAIGIDAVSELGDTMISTYFTSKNYQLKIQDDVRCKAPGAPGEWFFYKGNRVVFEKQSKYGAQYKMFGAKFKMFGALVDADVAKILISADDPRNPKIMLDQTFSTEIFVCENLTVGVEEVNTVGFDELKRELIYTGVSKNVISITYREFKRDMARPAFTQDLKFDLGEGDLIGFKGSRFKVISANNIEIKYQVVKPLD